MQMLNAQSVSVFLSTLGTLIFSIIYFRALLLDIDRNRAMFRSFVTQSASNLYYTSSR
jgi:hypothetical protein